MSRHMLPALALSLLLLGCACGPAYAANGALANSVKLFAPWETVVHKKVGASWVTKNDVNSFASPFVAGGNGVMIALAEARYTESEDGSVDVVVRYIGTEGENWADYTAYKNGNSWGTRSFVFKDGSSSYNARKPTAVIKGNKTYLLTLRKWSPDGRKQRSDHWYLDVAVGEIWINEMDKRIEWSISKSLGSKLSQKLRERKLELSYGHGYSAFLTSKETIVFSANATNSESKMGHAIIQLEDDKEQWGVSFVERPEGCRFFSLFEWKERLIIVFSGCRRGNTYAKEYDEVSEGWKDADDTLFHFLSDQVTSRDVTPATIENKNVLLFTEESTVVGLNGKRAIPLWFTDGIRTRYVGLIYTPYDNATSGGLLYTNGELFSMYQDTSKKSGAIVLARLDRELREIRQVLKIWTRNDAYLSRPCKETASENASPDTFCVTPMPTDGLVGFLSNKSDATHWHDEYRFTNATLKRGVKVKNGYTFSESFSGAQWSVGQRYPSYKNNFAKYELTVVATVTVHEAPNDDVSLLTVEGFGSKERLGLWCKGGQWKVVSTDGKEERAVELETQKEYRVALMLQSGAISVYVNGKSQGGPLPISGVEGGPFIIEDVFIAGYDSYNNVPMTVTNVLLYKRALDETELEALGKKIETAEPIDSEKKTEQATGQATGQTTETLTDSTGEPTPAPESTKKAETEPKLTKKTNPAPEATKKAETEPKLTKKTNPAPEATNKAEPAPELPNKAEPEPESTKKTEMPRDPEDSFVCVRTSFTSLFLLGCFCLAIF